jgi:dienelactone hydrolase
MSGLRIPTASGDELEAWLYLPEGDGPHPAVVMAHGIGAIKAGGLAPFAERFCREGFAAVAVDYRQWGGSAGQPRECRAVGPIAVLVFRRSRDIQMR